MIAPEWSKASRMRNAKTVFDNLEISRAGTIPAAEVGFLQQRIADR
jgi:hypothetical protein